MIQNNFSNILIVLSLTFQFDLLLAIICKGHSGHLSRLTKCFQFCEVRHAQLSCFLLIKYERIAVL